MYLSTTDSNCHKWEDLKGKQLFVPAKGSVPDIMTQHFLNRHGLIIGDSIELVYSNHTEIAQLIKSGKAKYAVDVRPTKVNKVFEIKEPKHERSLTDAYLVRIRNEIIKLFQSNDRDPID